MSTTPGAHLRPLRASDADDVLAAFAHDPSMTRQGDVRTRADAESYIDAVRGEAVPGAFALVLEGEGPQGTAAGVVVGVIGVGPVDVDNGIGWFWYWLHREHRGRGLASAAAASVAGWALGLGGCIAWSWGIARTTPPPVPSPAPPVSCTRGASARSSWSRANGSTSSPTAGWPPTRPPPPDSCR